MLEDADGGYHMYVPLYPAGLLYHPVATMRGYAKARLGPWTWVSTVYHPTPACFLERARARARTRTRARARARAHARARAAAKSCSGSGNGRAVKDWAVYRNLRLMHARIRC